MIALEITEIGLFMNKLLKSEMFDHFLLQEAVITSGASFVIDGHINKEFYSQEELDELCLSEVKCLPFSMLRTRCFDLIKGKKTPTSFKFVFTLSPDNMRRTIESSESSYSYEDISGIYLNLKYQNQLLTCTTGISYNTFSPDKSLEANWDELIKKFLYKHDVNYEEL